MAEKKQSFQSLEIKVEDIELAGDPLAVPTVFADYIRGGMAAHGVVRFNLVENRLALPNAEVRSVTVARVAMPVNQLRAWSKFFSDLADQQELPPLKVRSEPAADG